MAETTISARIPLKLKQELDEFIEKEHLERSVAVRKLLYRSLREWREELALEMLSKGEVTFSSAAKFSGLDVWTFAEKVKKSGLVWIKRRDVLEKEIEKAVS